MAARTRTLDEMVADVRYRADVQDNDARHPLANVRRLINESWQTLRELLSDQGYPHFLKAKSGTVTVGEIVPDAVGNPSLTAAFGTIDFPDDAIRIYALHVQLNGRIVALEPVSFQGLQDYQCTFFDSGNRRGDPYGFFPYNVGTESSASVTAGKIAIVPAPDAAIGYTVWYLPIWVDLATGAHVFNSLAGFEQWVIWDCVIKISARDNDAKAMYAIAVEERRSEFERILKAADRLQRAGPRRIEDTRGRRRRYRLDREEW